MYYNLIFVVWLPLCKTIKNMLICLTVKFSFFFWIFRTSIRVFDMELCEIQCYLFCFSAVSLLFSCKIMRIFRRPIYDTFRQRILYISKYTLMHFKTFCGGLWPDCLRRFTILERKFCRCPQFRNFWIQTQTKHQKLRSLLFARRDWVLLRSHFDLILPIL